METTSGSWTWTGRLVKRAGLSPTPTFEEVVRALAAIPYGRPACRTPEGVLEDWRGTCSTKHTLLALVCEESFPERALEVVHRVYRLLPDEARALFGGVAAATVPSEGLVDVHTFATALVGGRRLPIDVTLPRNQSWDGGSPMEIACGPGEDHPAGTNPLASKAMLVTERCDPTVREPFIEALARGS